MEEGEKNRNIRILHSGVFTPLRRWGTKWSLWPCHFVTSCCGVELAHAFACGFDGERLGTLNMGIARQANFIIVEGTITRKMAPALRIVWEQMPDPKFVNVIGACGQRGGIFWNSYNIVHPSDVVPVDFFIPGCPITPEGLLRGVRAVQEKIEGRDRTTIEFKHVDLPSVEKEEHRVPTTPKIFAPTPAIRVDVPREVDWDFGKEVVNNLKAQLGGLYNSIAITDKNRIAIKTTPENLMEVARKLSDSMGIDHVKNVNVIDVAHERKFIVEYMVSGYSKELMPVIITIFTEIGRETEAEAEPGFPSLTPLWESANYSEREMHDFFGVSFEGNKGMNEKFLLAPDTPEYPLRKDFKVEEELYVLEEGVPLAPTIKPPEELTMPVSEETLDEAEKNDEMVACIGPHHPGSGHLRWIMRLKGDVIVEVNPDPGYVHRSMEKLAENRLYIQNVPLFERANISDPINMNLGYVRAIENALGVEVPERAKYLRTIMAELSRIGAFFYDAGIFSLFTGHSTGFMYVWAIREMILEAIVRMTGSRCTPSFIIPGGIRRDISDDVLELTRNFTFAIDTRLRKFEDIFVTNPVFIARTKGVGVLTREDAIRCGIVGPFLRASGVEYDIRKAEPYEVYDQLDWEATTGDAGDCLGRFLGRLEEIKQSVGIVRQAVDAVKGMPRGNVISEEILGEYKEVSDDIRGYFFRVYGNLVLPKGEWTSITEASRGTLLYSIISDGESNVPYRVRVVTPCWMNLRGIIEASKGERVADFWTVYGSFGYFPPEADR
ncbi:MAG: NADH-quinone oxidoreductase subunit D [Methanophagales archaeon]|nr:NADH-quinone oxidoreductase subunit D [Methanophagales archaeon]